MAESISAQYQNKNDKKRQKCLQQLNQMVLLQLKKSFLNLQIKIIQKNKRREENERIRINSEKIVNNKEKRKRIESITQLKNVGAESISARQQKK